MPMIVSANVSALLDAISAGDEDRVIRETLQLIGPEHVPPAKIAARAGIAAAWAGGDAHPLVALSPVGQITLWMKSIPPTPDPDAEARQNLAPIFPLVQSFMAIANLVKRGLPEPHPQMPEPILPATIRHDGGVIGALKETVVSGDLARARGILMGLYATGTDYRALLTNIYGAVATRYPEGGHVLSQIVGGVRVLDMAEWGDRTPAFIYWATPLMLDKTPDTPAAETARTYASAGDHDLGWLRTRLAIPKPEAAGADFQRALVAGDGGAACDAVLGALRDGANQAAVASGIALAAADRVNSVPAGDLESLVRAAHVLQYAHAVHVVMLQTQNREVWPLLFTAACAVNAVRVTGSPADLERGAASGPSATPGGLIAASMLRRLEQQVYEGDTASALALARRYVQMGHPARALAGIATSVASMRDIREDQPLSYHIMPTVAAAAEEYLALPPALASGGYNSLLVAMVRLASELSAGHVLADKLRAAIAAHLGQV